MRKSVTKSKASGVVITALIATAIATVGGARAQADSPLVDVTGFRTTNISVSSQGCKNVPVTMYVSSSQPGNTSTSLTTHIYRGAREVDSASFNENTPDTWYWCSYMGFGTFRLGPSDGSVSVWTGDEYPTYAVQDNTLGYVKVKTRSIQSVSRTSRYRGYVWVTGRSLGYNANGYFGASSYIPWGRAKVVLQYRMPGSTVWKYANWGYSNALGSTTIKVHAPTGRYWRLVSQEGGSVWGSASGQAYR